MSMDNNDRSRKKAREKCRIKCGPTRTKQSDVKEADINVMVARYTTAQSFSNVNRISGQFADVSNLPDYKESRNQVIAAENLFGALPSKIRERFDNDPGKMVSFFSNPENKEEAMRLGLVPRPEIKKIVPPAEGTKKSTAPDASGVEPKPKAAEKKKDA